MADERRLIDANALMKYINDEHSYAGLPMAAHILTMELLTYAPTVDAVEVRCGECRFVDTDACPMSGTPGRVSASDCYDRPYPTEPDDFCSYGERRAGAGH